MINTNISLSRDDEKVAELSARTLKASRSSTSRSRTLRDEVELMTASQKVVTAAPKDPGTDVDMANESLEFARVSILQSPMTAMLAQSNVNGDMVWSLITPR